MEESSNKILGNLDPNAKCKTNIREYDGEKKVYWPHIGVTEWDEMFYQNMQWKTYLDERRIILIWQGPWKLQYHGPLSMVFFDDWGFEDITFGGIRKKDIMMVLGKKLLTDNPTTKIKLDDIASVPNEDIQFLDDNGMGFDKRYKSADTSWPLIVVEGMSNPYGKPYRCIDGRRRIHKLKNIENKQETECYVLSMDEIREIVFRYEVISYEQAIREQ